jgi:hypothetical protein
MRTQEAACKVAREASKKDPKPFYVVRVLDDELYGPFAVCDDYELDGYFCGVQDQDILNVFLNGTEVE